MFLSRKPHPYLTRHLRLFERLKKPIILMLERVLANDEVARLVSSYGEEISTYRMK